MERLVVMCLMERSMVMFDGLGKFDGELWAVRIQEQIQVPFIDRGGVQRGGLGVGLGGPGVRVEELRR